MNNNFPYMGYFCKLLVEHMAKGNSFDSFACTLNYPPHIVRSWLDKKTAFAEARSIGENARLKCLEDMLLTKVINLETFKHLTQNEESEIDSAVSSFNDDVLIQARERFAK